MYRSISIAALALAAVLAGCGGQPPQTVNVPLNGPGPTITVTTTPQALDQAAPVRDHADGRDQSPTGVSGKTLRAGQRQLERFAKRDQLPTLAPDAAPEVPGCRSAFVRNYSSRRGVSPRLFVLHYTVSPNRPGRSDVNAITSLFDRASFQASSNFVIDAEGNCNYIVRLTDKPWTQAGFNPASISVEVIATGKEARYLGPAGQAKLVRVIRHVSRLFDIPIRRGAVNGCTVTRSGILDHKSLGACGGGHVDISPYSIEPIISAVKRSMRGRGDNKVTCRKLNWWRTHGKPHGLPESRAVRRRKALEARRVVCTAKGPVKA